MVKKVGTSGVHLTRVGNSPSRALRDVGEEVEKMYSHIRYGTPYTIEPFQIAHEIKKGYRARSVLREDGRNIGHIAVAYNGPRDVPSCSRMLNLIDKPSKTSFKAAGSPAFTVTVTV